MSIQTQKILLCSLLFSASSAIKLALKDQMFPEYRIQSRQTTRTCTSAIDRVNSQLSIDWKTLCSQQTQWTDTSFPISDALRWNGFTTASGGEGWIVDAVSWDHAYTKISNSFIMPSIGNMYDEINQGELGDCYFLAGLSGIAEITSRMNQAILTKQISPSGVFAAQVFIRGIPSIVVVDDLVPFYYDSVTTYDHEGDDGAVWGLMLEKVWAKINGNYENIIGGNSEEVFKLILGAPTTYIDIASTYGYNPLVQSTWAPAIQNVWSAISSSANSQFVQGCSVGSSNPLGLVNNHAYTVLGAYQIKNNNVVTNQLYRIRNPWGEDVYNGTWNDLDTLSWTSSAQSQVGFVNDTEDGDFWVEDKDFLKAFQAIMISYYHDSYVNSYVSITGDTLQVYKYKFTTTSTQEVNIMVDFYPKRMYAKGCRTSSSTGYLSLSTINGASIQSNYYVSDNYVSNFLNFPMLAANTYIISFQMKAWDAAAVKDFTLRVYAPQAVTLAVPSQADLNGAVAATLQLTMSNGYLSNNPSYTKNSTYTYLRYGYQGTTVYADIQPIKSCRTLPYTLTLNYVDDSQLPPLASVGVCTKFSTNVYKCVCDLSLGINQICKYSYFSLNNLVSISQSASGIIC